MNFVLKDLLEMKSFSYMTEPFLMK